MKRIAGLVSAALAVAVAGAPVAWAGDTTRPDSGTRRYDADNTGRNVRDRDAGAKTAGQQSNAPADVRLTREIRRAVVADDSLSTNAHNVKIVTTNGVVTLRGPVNSPEEKTRIQEKAQTVAGVKRVDNKLEITRR